MPDPFVDALPPAMQAEIWKIRDALGDVRAPEGGAYHADGQTAHELLGRYIWCEYRMMQMAAEIETLRSEVIHWRVYGTAPASTDG